MAQSDLAWYHMAICRNMDINYFFDDYEDDSDFAINIDDICRSCPVREICLREGLENKETGVWGGIYLTAGRFDAKRNAHKPKAELEQLAEALK